MEFGFKQTVTQDSATEWVFSESIYIARVFSSQSAQTRIKEFLPANHTMPTFCFCWPALCLNGFKFLRDFNHWETVYCIVEMELQPLQWYYSVWCELWLIKSSTLMSGETVVVVYVGYAMWRVQSSIWPWSCFTVRLLVTHCQCHLGTIAQLCRAISSQLRHISTIGKTC